jgi:rhomboid protease GluP
MDSAHAAPGSVRPRLAAVLATMPATLAICALCVVAWTAAALTGDTTSAKHLIAVGALERGHVWAGEPWRILTAPFLHAGALHLLWNVAGALVSCGPVERALGSRRFLTIYLAAAVGGSALSLLAQDAVSVGASGALFGIIGAVLALRHRALGGWRAFTADPPTRHLLIALALWNVAGVVLALAGIRMDHFAHLGGFVAGALAARVVTSRRPARRAAIFVPLLALLVAVAAWPRPRLSKVTAWELEEALSSALQRDDRPVAAALVHRGLRGGLDTPFFRFAQARVLLQRGDIAPALALLRPLREVPDPKLREAVRSSIAWAASVLAWRNYRGEGMPKDDRAAAALYTAACAAGDRQSCRYVGLEPEGAGRRTR